MFDYWVGKIAWRSLVIRYKASQQRLAPDFSGAALEVSR